MGLLLLTRKWPVSRDCRAIYSPERAADWVAGQDDKRITHHRYKTVDHLDAHGPLQTYPVTDRQLTVLGAHRQPTDRNVERARCILRVTAVNVQLPRFRRRVAGINLPPRLPRPHDRTFAKQHTC